MKRFFYSFYLPAFAVMVITLAWMVFYMDTRSIPLFFFGVGVLTYFLKDTVSLYLFLFLLPFINAAPSLLSSPYPYNYTAPSVFLLSGIMAALFFKTNQITKSFGKVQETLSRKGFLVVEDRSGDEPGFWGRDFYFYRLFLLLLVISGFFLFLRWSNITLGVPGAVGADTPASAPIPRLTLLGDLKWYEQRISFAAIFPVVSLFFYFITPFVFFYIKRVSASERTIFQWISCGFYISTVMGVIQKIRGFSGISDRLGKELKQFNGGFSDFNAFGVFSGMMFLWSTYEIRNKNPLGYATFGVSLVGGVLSGSRTTFFFIAVGLLNLVLGVLKERRKQKTVIIGLIVVVGVLIAIGGGTMKKRLMGADWDPKYSFFDKVDAAVNGRLKMAVFSVQTINDYFFTGVGTGNFSFYLTYKNYLRAKLSGKAYLYDLPMNQYLWVFTENGVLAFVFFTIFMVFLYRRSEKKLLMGAVLFSLLFNNFFWLPEAFILFWILAAANHGGGVRVGLQSGEGGAFAGSLTGCDNIGNPADNTPISKSFWRSGNLFSKRVLVFVTVLLAVVFHFLSFQSLHPAVWAKRLGFMYDWGFWAVEKDEKQREFQWTKADAGRIIALDKNGESLEFRLVCGAPLDRFPNKMQTVKIYWKKKLYREYSFTGNGEYRFRIKSVPFDWGFMELKIQPVFVPGEISRSVDTRDLGIRFSSSVSR